MLVLSKNYNTFFMQEIIDAIHELRAACADIERGNATHVANVVPDELQMLVDVALERQSPDQIPNQFQDTSARLAKLIIPWNETLLIMHEQSAPLGTQFEDCYEAMAAGFRLLLRNNTDPGLRPVLVQLNLLVAAFRLAALSVFRCTDHDIVPPYVADVREALLCATALSRFSLARATCFEALNYIANRTGQQAADRFVADASFVEAARFAFEAVKALPNPRYVKYLGQNAMLVGDVRESDAIRIFASKLYTEGYCASHLGCLLRQAHIILGSQGCATVLVRPEDLAYWEAVPLLRDDCLWFRSEMEHLLNTSGLRQGLTADLLSGVLFARQMIGGDTDRMIGTFFGSSNAGFVDCGRPIYESLTYNLNPLFCLWRVLHELIGLGCRDGDWQDLSLQGGWQSLSTEEFESVSLTLRDWKAAVDGESVSFKRTGLGNMAGCVYGLTAQYSGGVLSDAWCHYWNNATQAISAGQGLGGINY